MTIRSSLSLLSVTFSSLAIVTTVVLSASASVAACSDANDIVQSSDALQPDGGALDAHPPPAVADAASAPSVATSCANDAQAPGISNCGKGAGESCCSSLTVPGGTFLRDYDGVTYTATGYPATLSDFRLDRFEATVGRFRSFTVAVSAGWLPPAGSGKHAHLNGGKGLQVATTAAAAYETGWDSRWNASLAGTAADWTKNLSCSATYQTWTPDLSGDEARPINCATWFEAYAFCIWDGGFLPTEAEWSYAAEGGKEQRVYPWANPPTSSTIDCTYATFGGATPPSTACAAAGTTKVGSEPKGDGKWGHADLAGNVWEWSLDSSSGYTQACRDCANLDASLPARVIRGGSFAGDPSGVLAAYGLGSPPDARDYTIGARCARAPSSHP